MFGIEYRPGPTGSPRLSLPCSSIEKAKARKKELEADGFMCWIVFYPTREMWDRARSRGDKLPSLYRFRHLDAA